MVPFWWIRRTQYITSIDLFYKEVGKACGAGFLIMIKYIYNQMFYLQELGILLGGCLTVKN